MELQHLPYVRFFQLPQNVGRSKIRNMLVQKASYPHLLFLDCDVEISDSAFIRRYVQVLSNQVVCGGLGYASNYLDESMRLRWIYGKKREAKAAHIRRHHPYDNFVSGNFLISKSVFSQILFNEKIRKYGHEDTLFGIQLQEKNVEITHIDNVVLHQGLESADIFIRKTEDAISNLKELSHKKEYAVMLERHVRLLRTYKRLQMLHLHHAGKFVFYFFRKSVKRNLEGKHPNLFLFDLYKLGFICSC